MTPVDWVALGLVLLAALGGAVQGFVWSGLSLAGLVAGALIGGRLVPVLLSNGTHSRYAPVVALVAAITFAVVFEVLGSTVGASIRSRQDRSTRALDSAGGVVAGALIGFAIVWVLGAMALQLPGQADLRRAVQRSYVLQRLNGIVPPRSLLNALARIDPFPSFAGPPVPTEPLDPLVLRKPGVRAAAPSVVRVLGTACGLGVEGSGWVAGPGLVVTAAHVVAGEEDTEVVTLSGGALRAQAFAFDPHNDVAVLRVDGLEAPPLELRNPQPGAAVAIVGYPLNGPLEASAGRIGETETVLAQDAYGRGKTRRLVTSLSGTIQHGNSGGPAVDSSGAVQSTVFAARAVGGGGYGVPASVVRRDLASASTPVSTGPCVG
ncbi:MAG TPA: MarP family serine protease [Gaiellaceae bacterium]|nr:MarP family serine protease [Gaiellaceae bacterium]